MDDKEGLLDELQEELGGDYSPQLRVAAQMLTDNPGAAVPYLMFSIAKSLEDISFLLANDSISIVNDLDEDELQRAGRNVARCCGSRLRARWSTAPTCWPSRNRWRSGLMATR